MRELFIGPDVVRATDAVDDPDGALGTAGTIPSREALPVLSARASTCAALSSFMYG